MKTWGLLLLGVMLALPVQAATEDAEKKGQLEQRLPTVPLVAVLDAVKKNTKLEFAIDHGAPAAVVIGQLQLRSLDYEKLLLVLRNNALAAVKSSGVVNILPVSTIRQTGLPIIDTSNMDAANQNTHDEEWVMGVHSVEHAAATMFVPIMRPLLPQQAHMVAHADSNTILIVSRYATLKQIVSLVTTLDQGAEASQ